MNDQHHSEPANKYPVGRGYGNDYMRGGEVFGGYGYSEREEYELPRGELAELNAESGDLDEQGRQVS